jgi:hypothetical protein
MVERVAKALGPREVVLAIKVPPASVEAGSIVELNKSEFS